MQSEADHDSSVKVENRRGQWVPAIPLPFFGLRKRCCAPSGEGMTACRRKFWTLEGYRAHYALAHILKLDEGC